MQPEKRSGPPPQEPAREVSATAKQLDLTVDSTPTGDTTLRTEPDPAARRRNLEEGRRRRDEGMAYAGANTPIGWRDLVDQTIRDLAASGRPFTADDVREVTGHPLGASDNAFGAAIGAASRTGLIATVGYQQSTRPERHGGVLRVWRGTGVGR